MQDNNIHIILKLLFGQCDNRWVISTNYRTHLGLWTP